jgi:predicted nucleic acid-binding protein
MEKNISGYCPKQLPAFVISDTSCLINLERIDLLPLLQQLFRKIIITEEVALEFDRELPDWIEVRKTSRPYLWLLQNKNIHSGEASAIELGLELGENCLLLIDDKVARSKCKEFGLRFIGLLGVLLQAQKAGIIEQIRPFIEHLQKVGFRVSQNLVQKILCETGETGN